MEKNKAQEEVINTSKGQSIVVACPGSGKTTSMLRRINRMVEKGIPENEILMVTFTASAAKEMKDRYNKQYGKSMVTFCTIHSLCLSILIKFAGLDRSKIFTDTFGYFVEKARYLHQINDKNEFVKGLILEMSVVKNNDINISRYTPKCCEDKDLFIKLIHEYEAYKESLGYIDFDDMMIRAYQLMQKDNNVLSWLRNTYKYIQVDECQDINTLQRDIIYLLAGENGNLVMVGDDDQSIYGFRGSKPEIMLNFQKDYPDAKLIRMNTNYRSCTSIIEAADKVICENKNRFDKEFIPFKKEEGIVKEMHYRDREAQIKALCYLINNADCNPEDVAILYRTNAQAEAVAAAMIQNNIPYHSTEKIESRYDNWLFRDIVSYYNLAKGISTKVDMQRVLNHPQRYLLDKRYYDCKPDRKEMFAVCSKIKQKDWQESKARTEILDFCFMIKKLKGLKPVDFLNKLYSMGYKKYLREYSKYRGLDKEEYESLWNSYLNDAKKNNSWEEWNRYIQRYNYAIKNMNKNQKGVTLSTMHCSKGLEWKKVYLIDCIEGICPFAKAETEEELAEERRLFYVAMTRAKEELYICYYDYRNNQLCKKSEYLDSLLCE